MKSTEFAGFLLTEFSRSFEIFHIPFKASACAVDHPLMMEITSRAATWSFG